MFELFHSFAIKPKLQEMKSSTKNLLRNLLIFLYTCLIITQLIFIDGTDLRWEINETAYHALITLVLILAAMIYSKRYDKTFSE